MSILNGLNDVQKQAASHVDGPLVVFAGAGSGKTTIITSRIAHLIENGVRPWEILAVTFTNKAAAEMRNRVQRLSFDANRCQISTFHSICARWLREFAEELGFRSDFLIYDDADSNSALKKIIKESMQDVDLAPVLADMKAFMHLAKTNGVFPSEAERLDNEFGGLIPDGGIEIYRRYQEYLASCNAMDFGDLIMNSLLLLRRNERVRNALQQRYRYVLVDEFQDTNRAQLEMIQLLCDKHKNIFVVGDDDQSIYSWRGATPVNLIDFDKLYPGAKKVTMAQNYRSATNIVAAASAMVSHNKRRVDKKLFSENSSNHSIVYRSEADGEMEAWYIVDRIKEELIEFDYSDFAIFYRTNSQSRLLEEALRRENMPYRIFGSVKFYDRLEVKDILAYIRLMVNEDDDVSLKRIINVPTRGIGAKAVQMLEQEARTRSQTMLKTARQLAQENVPRLGAKLAVFLKIFEELRANVQNNNIAETVSIIVDGASYKDHLVKKYPDQVMEKAENLHELSAAVADFAKRSPEEGLSEWLQMITIARDEAGGDDGIEGVSLMTLHMAKGLEYKRVFIVGVEDGLIPHRNNMEDVDLLEEERRLFYVGMTRAKEKLTMVGARERMVYNQHMMNDPSQFLLEIPKEHLTWEGIQEESSSTGASKERDLYDDWSDDSYVLEEGMQVVHPTYGRGVIMSIEKQFGKEKAVVRFSEFGQRKVAMHHLCLAQISF